MDRGGRQRDHTQDEVLPGHGLEIEFNGGRQGFGVGTGIGLCADRIASRGAVRLPEGTTCFRALHQGIRAASIGGILEQEEPVHVLGIVMEGAPVIGRSGQVLEGEGDPGGGAIHAVVVTIPAIAAAGVDPDPVGDEV